MKVDRYTKVILTIVATALSVLAASQFSSPVSHAAPPTPAAEVNKFAHIDFQYSGSTMIIFDKSTGDIWNYGAFGNDQDPKHQKLVKLGDPLEKD